MSKGIKGGSRYSGSRMELILLSLTRNPSVFIKTYESVMGTEPRKTLV